MYTESDGEWNFEWLQWGLESIVEWCLMDDMNRNIDNCGMISMSSSNDDEYWMTCMRNLNDDRI